MKRSPIRKVSPQQAKQKRHEQKLREQALIRCQGRCENCLEYPDWRGLSLSHTKPKGMGRNHHEYTMDEVQLLCAKCHSARHGIIENSD